MINLTLICKQDKIVYSENLIQIGELPSEEFVKDYFEKQGYKVIKVLYSTYSKSVVHGIVPSELLVAGCPDFLIKKGNIVFFVEAKTGNEKLRESQVKWIEKWDDDFLIILARVEYVFTS